MIIDLFDFPFPTESHDFNLELTFESTLNSKTNQKQTSSGTISSQIGDPDVFLFSPYQQLNEESNQTVYGGYCGINNSSGQESTDFTVASGAASFDDCMNACNVDTNCVAFEWNSNLAECELWINMPTEARFRTQISSCIQSTLGSSGQQTDCTINGQCFIKLSNELSSDSAKLTLRGRGFDASNPTKNTVSFTGDIGKALVFTSTRTTLGLSFTHLSPVDNDEDLKAIVTVHSTWSSGTVGVFVAKILGANPTVLDDGDVLSSDSPKFTIMGKGFDASNANLHTFSLSGNVKALLGSSAKSTHTSLEISFTHLSPLDEGNLNAAVTVDTTWSSSGTFQF